MSSIAPDEFIGAIDLWLQENYCGKLASKWDKQKQDWACHWEADNSGIIRISYTTRDEREWLVDLHCYELFLQIQDWTAAYDDPSFFDELKIAIDKLLEGGSLWEETDDWYADNAQPIYDPHVVRRIVTLGITISSSFLFELIRIRGPPGEFIFRINLRLISIISPLLQSISPILF